MVPVPQEGQKLLKEVGIFKRKHQNYNSKPIFLKGATSFITGGQKRPKVRLKPKRKGNYLSWRCPKPIITLHQASLFFHPGSFF